MLGVGREAPSFTLTGAAAGTIDTQSRRVHGERVVLVFYPFGFHPACTGQWCSLRAADWLTVLEGVAVFGVGSDATYAHRERPRYHPWRLQVWT